MPNSEKKSSFKLRPYQKKIVDQGKQIIRKHGFVYLAMEVRTGKTYSSLAIASEIGSKSVLFLTKKKAIKSIESDYDTMSPEYDIVVINYESVHKFEDQKYDTVIVDEAHSLGAFPKPSSRARAVRRIVEKNKAFVILLSGTPTPESYSQLYHQVYGIPANPFREYSNFYKFARRYVDISQRMINSNYVNDYSKGRKEIVDRMAPYTISLSQKEAGFTTEVKEDVLYVDMKPSTYKMAARLSRDLVLEGKEEVVLADTPVKLMQKLHQMYSGTVKFESGNSKIIDLSKAQFIYDNFCACKIGIFYKFKEELNALKEVYGDQLCTTLEEFDSTDKTIALQIVSGREGVSLRKAEYIVYYNIDFSATSYWQSRDRMTTMDRKETEVYWVFSRGGIEDDIYAAVKKKKNYTLSHFKKRSR